MSGWPFDGAPRPAYKVEPVDDARQVYAVTDKAEPDKPIEAKPGETPINELTLAHYKRGIDAIFDSGRLLP